MKSTASSRTTLVGFVDLAVPNQQDWRRLLLPNVVGMSVLIREANNKKCYIFLHVSLVKGQLLTVLFDSGIFLLKNIPPVTSV